jgi:aminoglycoside phosphotransferase (APT) family kinase protein
MPGLPKHAEEIDATWLTEALRASGAIDAGTKVTDVDIDPVAAGIGFMGEVARITPTYEGGSGPVTVVAKIPTQDPHVRELLAPARVFEREARFYQHLAPHLDVTPTAHHVGADEEAGDYILLLEDLGHLRVGDQIEGASADDAAAALEALAHLHAAFWTSPRLDELDWMPRIDDAGMKIGKEIYAASLPGFLQVFGDVLADVDADMEVVERFSENVHQLMDRFGAMPHTIVHFDYRLDNLFFGGDVGPGVTMIDFQASTKGGGAYDVGYFLSQNLPVDVRRRHEDDLLRQYHDVLVADGVENYPLDQLRADYRAGVLYGWIIPVYAVGTLDSSSERAMMLWREVIGRAHAAINDHAVRELLL